VKPRECEVALETPEYIAWKGIARSINESTPLHIKTYEKVRMIEYSAVEELVKALEQIQYSNRLGDDEKYGSIVAFEVAGEALKKFRGEEWK
jgi:hypothetical protein